MTFTVKASGTYNAVNIFCKWAGVYLPHVARGGVFPGVPLSNLYLPLKSTIVPTWGTSTPTYTRATAAWMFDNEQKLIEVPSDCARFSGARMVRNHVATTSATLASGSTSTVTLAKAETVTFSIGAGTGTATFSGTAGASGTLAASASGRTEVTKTCTAGTFIVTASVATLVDIQVEVVSDQADQTASEYVSIGVLASPYHGAGTAAGADGEKFYTTNKNGTPISSAILEGYLAEPSRTNNCLWARGMTGTPLATVSASRPWNPSLGASVTLANGNFATNDLTGWSDLSIGTGTADASTGACVLTGTDTSNRVSIEQAVTTVIGTQYAVKFDVTRTSGGIIAGINTTPGEVVSTLLHNSTASASNKIIVFTATATTTYLKFFTAGTGGVGSVDNISIAEAGIQVTQTTGLDNIANSASVLTAAANDATITQLLTSATGTRTYSAYIKRVTGTGTISLTRDAGVGWTDVTSQLLLNQWVKVALISNVGANATVGIRMGTDTDVIHVDVNQDENGAWATSPILTTTAAVTRNADVLSYATAFDVAQGTALCQLRSDVPLSTSSAVALAGDANARMVRFGTATARDSGEAWDATNTATATGLSIATGNRKRASRWGADLRMCADGTLGTAESFDGSMGASTTLFVGCNQAGEDQVSGPIAEINFWNDPLTDAQFQTVTV